VNLPAGSVTVCEFTASGRPKGPMAYKVPPTLWLAPSSIPE
jgi:hypothetical protein